jgi:transposase-like protein
VDLTRQLSNPRVPLRRLADLDLRTDASPTGQPDRTGSGSPRAIHRRLQPQELADLAAAYEAGATTHELAARFGIHRNTVSAHLERADVTTRTRRGLSPDDVDEAARLYHEGWSGARLAKKFGVSDHTIRATLRNVGVRIRPRRGGPGWPTRSVP